MANATLFSLLFLAYIGEAFFWVRTVEIEQFLGVGGSAALKIEVTHSV